MARLGKGIEFDDSRAAIDPGVHEINARQVAQRIAADARLEIIDAAEKHVEAAKV